MTMSDINLEKYFEKIGFTGPAPATLGTLKRLQALHTTAIPFENIDPLMGRPVSLDLSALSEKFLDQGRGGYCYEQNIFFQGVLKSLGFSVSGLAAVVQWDKPAECGPRVHMVLRVELPEGEFIADVGFGRLTLTSPLELVPTIEQKTTLEDFRLMPINGEFQVQCKLGGRWAALYKVSLQTVSLDDYAVFNWFTSTNPESVFTNHLMVARPTDKLRYGMFDNHLSIHYPTGQTEKRKIQSSEELSAVLKENFLIRLPEGCGPTLERLIQSNEKAI
jgi:N-hydroxyarylamine O-acetyltransferase